MDWIKRFLRKAFLPVTVLLVPHDHVKRVSFRIPLLGILISFSFMLLLFGYLLTVTVHNHEFRKIKYKLSYYQQQFEELNESIQAIKKAESEFKKIFSKKNKDQIIENYVAAQRGSVNIDVLREEIQPTVETVEEIKKFLDRQKTRYQAVPRGLPVEGRISSSFGMRDDPFSGQREFHPALDIQADTGSSVKATAGGVVSFAGWVSGNGNLVAIEHGLGYSTYYAHNKRLLVKAGQRVERGEPIALVGATGKATGPHTHYEVRKNGKPLDPQHLEGIGR